MDELEALRQQKREYMREWTARNREVVNGQRRERYATNHNGLRDERITRARREHLRKRGGFTEETKAFVSVLLQDPCAYCGEAMTSPGRITPEAAAVDHIDASGDSHWANLTGACGSCNSSKGKTSLLLFLLEQQLRQDLAPLAEQIRLIKGSSAQRRRIDF